MLDAQLFGFSCRMEWVTKADEAGYFRLIGHEARDPAAYRFAADEERVGLY